jgi:hypothetical protein
VILSGPLILGEVMDYLINYATKEFFSQDNQFYMISVFIIFGKILDFPIFLEKIKESSLLPISIVIFTLGENAFDSKEILGIYEEQKEELKSTTAKGRTIRKNVILRNFNEIYRKNQKNTQSMEVIFRPIQNGIFQEISKQVKVI